MFESVSRGRRTLVMLLFVVLTKSADSVKVEMEGRSVRSSDTRAIDSPVESPYWEHILREFLFKTISPPPPANNILYKEILEAPFYTGPFSAGGTSSDAETSQVLSRGDVYHLAEGGWIICQEGCVECDVCRMQKSIAIPAVKWILRKIKRPLHFANQKRRHDLQFTVLPQNDLSFHMKNLSPGSYVYVTSNKGALSSFKDTLIRRSKEYSIRYPFGTTTSPHSNTQGDVFPPAEEEGRRFHREEIVTEDPGNGNEVFRTEPQLEMTTTLIPEEKNSSGQKHDSEILQGGRNQRKIDDDDEDETNSESSTTPLTLFYPPTTPTAQSMDHPDCRTGTEARLIFGRDQFGSKHLVHVVPADELDAEITRDSAYPGSKLVYQQLEHPHPVHTEHEDRSLYRKIFRRVIDSLNTHKNAIEKFLFSPKREIRIGHGQPSAESTSGMYYENNITKTAGTEKNIIEPKGADGKSNDLKSAMDINQNEETASVSSTVTEVFDEEARVPAENDDRTMQMTDKKNQKNQAPDVHDELKRENNSESLILKEVAKSVVNQPDTLKGFNSIAETADSDNSEQKNFEESTGSGQSRRLV